MELVKGVVDKLKFLFIQERKQPTQKDLGKENLVLPGCLLKFVHLHLGVLIFIILFFLLCLEDVTRLERKEQDDVLHGVGLGVMEGCVEDKDSHCIVHEHENQRPNGIYVQ